MNKNQEINTVAAIRENGGKRFRENVHSTKSNRKGMSGFFETFLRRFRILAFIAALLPLYLLVILIAGISLTPSVFLFNLLSEMTQNAFPLYHFFVNGISIAAGYFLYGLTLIFVVPLFNFILPLRLKPFRGSYYSLESVPWFIHNALTYLVRFTFMEFITPTPLNILYYKMMGMRIGEGVHINTTRISDPSLIILEDYVTIGGSATLIAHYAAQGYLVIAPTIIRKGATIGLQATIMGDVEIGEGAVIGPHEVVLPKSRIPAGYKKKANEGHHLK